MSNSSSRSSFGGNRGSETKSAASQSNIEAIKQGSFADAAGDYLERHRVYETLQAMLRALAIHRPKAPLPFLINMLQQPLDQPRIIFAAPTDSRLSSRETQLARIVKEFGVIPIRHQDLLQEEVMRQTPLGVKIRSFIEKGQPVPDSLSVATISGRVNKPDCAAQGWILDGFPSTQTQAQLLQTAGVLASKYIMLDVPTDTLRIKLFELMQIEEGKGNSSSSTSSSSSSSSSPSITPFTSSLSTIVAAAAANINEAIPLVQRVESALTYITCTLTALTQQYSSIAAVISDKPGDDVSTTKQIFSYLHAIAPSNAPRRPPRILVLGPAGSCKQSIAQKLSSTLDAVHVRVTDLLQQEKGSTRSEMAESYITLGELIPDDVIVPIVIDRLKQSDCLSRGWVLEGFPRTLQQATALANAGILPSRCVILDAPDNYCVERVIDLRLDNLTGDLIRVSELPPNEAALIDKAKLNATDPKSKPRYTYLPQHREHTVRASVNTYRTGLHQVKAVYGGILT